VSTDNGETITRLVLFANSKSYNGAAIAGEVIFATVLNFAFVPVISFLQFFEASLSRKRA
jgi:hypothetical protein